MVGVAGRVHPERLDQREDRRHPSRRVSGKGGVTGSAAYISAVNLIEDSLAIAEVAGESPNPYGRILARSRAR